MKVNRPTGWTILVGLLLAVPAATYYSWLLWNSWMNKAELNAFVKTDKVELPVVYREYLHVMDSPFGRKQISAAYDAAIKDRSLIGFAPSDLEIMHKFTESIPLCSWRDTDVTSLKIVNIGRKTAHNVKVFFPESGFAEITKDGTAVDSGKTKTLELQDLEPSSQFVVKLWPTNGYSSASEIRVISDDGSTPVQTWNVPREGNRWVVAFGGSTL